MAIPGGDGPLLPQRVVVAAAHGSLECAGRHVLVGHFAGTPIAGAEAFVDERLGRRLTTRQLLGGYPERVGDAIVVEAPRPATSRAGYPPGAIVVGLDYPGELTRDNLSLAVSAGVVSYAIHVMETDTHGTGAPGTMHPLRLAAVPIGTSGVGAISVESCVAAIVDGVMIANEKLFARDDAPGGGRTWDHVRIAGLEIVEVLCDKAERIAHAVRQLRDLIGSDPASHTELVLMDRLRAGEGGLPASLSGPEHAGSWQRVVIRDLARERQDPSAPTALPEVATVLEFTAIGRRARADAMQVPVDRLAVDRLVEGAVRDARPNRQVGNTLYELLLPNDLKNDLSRTENLQLIVDENTADLPWEALTARFEGRRPRQLALRGGLLRQFRETEGARARRRAATGHWALVVGNPPPPAGLPTLPGAAREASAVARAVGARFDVAALVWDGHGAPVLDDFATVAGTPGRRVLDALFSRDWRILHLAAHGRFEPANTSASGVVIDAETAVTANVVRQLAAVPELVFLNCCHLARVDDRATDGADRHRLAASVARELMAIGVQAVIAAGWAVDDDAAVVFAETFYQRLLDGALLGAAVQAGRETVHRMFPGSTTWAAYQCYGDPGYRLFSARAPSEPDPPLVSADELVRRVKAIIVSAGKIGLPDFHELTDRAEEMIDELDRRRSELAVTGWATPVVLYHFGYAYGELGAYRRAVECFGQAWEHPDSSTAPVRLLEQLGNFEVRLAQRRAALTPERGVGHRGTEIGQLLEAAEGHLRLALGLGATPERLALLASFHKRAATLAVTERRRQHVADAAAAYRDAYELGDRLGRPLEPYHLLNWLQMASLAGAPAAGPTAQAALAHVVTAISPGTDGAAEDFWARVTVADLSLTRHLLGEAVDLPQLEADYAWAFATRSSRRDRDSVVDHLRDVAELRGDPGLAALAAGLETRAGADSAGGAPDREGR